MLIPSARTDGKKMDSPRGWAAEQWMEWNKQATSRRELAIRSAVGAQQKDIRKLIFGEGFRLIAGGVVVVSRWRCE